MDGSGLAFRCFLSTDLRNGGNILDPCFAPKAGAPGDLLCVPDPTVPEYHEVTTKARIPAAKDHFYVQRDWFITLSNGWHCTRRDGAGDMSHGLDDSYFCQALGWVWGDINKSSPMWTVKYSKNMTDPFTTATVVTAYD